MRQPPRMDRKPREDPSLGNLDAICASGRRRHRVLGVIEPDILPGLRGLMASSLLDPACIASEPQRRIDLSSILAE